MQRRLAIIAFSVLLAASDGNPAQAESASIVQQARAARLADQPGLSNKLLEEWLSHHPEDADAWLEQGYALTQLGDYASARLSFEQTLQISPRYADAEVALARIEYFEGNYAAALSRLSQVEPFTESSMLYQQVSAAMSAKQPGFIRADLFGEHSTLSQDLPDWTASSASLVWQASPETTIAGTIEHTQRFDREDVFAQVQVDRHISARWTTYAGLGGTVNADFRPRSLLYAGTGIALSPTGGSAPALKATVFSSIADYTAGRVITISPGLTQTFYTEAVYLGARLIVLQDETDTFRFGQVLEAGADLSSQLGVSAIWSDAPETSEGRTLDVETTSLSLRWSVSDRLGIRVSAVSEARSAYDRTALSVSLSRSFR
jgi:YaiO family outer membrane protein